MNRCLLINSIWRMMSRHHARRFARALDRPVMAQEQLLRETLRCNERTDFGRRHRFDKICSVDEFQARVPIRTYCDFEPWIARITAGEREVLTREPVLRLIPTSGSSAARKLIPWTRTLQRQFSRAIGPWVVDLFLQYPQAMHGPAYWSISPAVSEDRKCSAAVPIGFEDDSDYLGGLLKPLIDSVLAVPSEVRHVGDVDAFRYITLLGLLRARELRLMSVWHPSFLAIVLDALPVYWDALLQDLARGTLSPPGNVTDRIARTLPGRLRSMSQRADELASVGPKNLRAIWPHLQLVSCWTDARAAGPAAELSERLPGVALQPKGLLATEAVATLPILNQRPLAVCSHFFEFLSDDGQAHTIDRIEQGYEYTLVVTTGGGLYRYNLGDRVEVTGRLHGTPTLRFLGRGDRCSDLCGEKLSDAFVERVLERALADGVDVRFAMLAPDSQGSEIGYTLYVEAAALSPNIAPRLETGLCENPHYDYARRLGQLRAVEVFRIGSHAHRTFLNAPHRGAMRLGDVKPASLDPFTGWSTLFDGTYEHKRERALEISQ